jgi:hypothetical protein
MTTPTIEEMTPDSPEMRALASHMLSVGEVLAWPLAIDLIRKRERALASALEKLGKAREIAEIIHADNTAFLSYDKKNDLTACEAIHRAVIETCDDILAALLPAPEVNDV